MRKETLNPVCGVAIVCAVATLAGLGNAPAEEALIRIAGSSTVQPIVTRAASQYHELVPELRIVVGGGGSGNGVKAVGQGEVQVGMSSRALKPIEQRQWPDLRPTTIGLDGIAIIVHARNPVTQITTRQVQEAFTGRIADWRRLGGPDSALVLVSTNERHGTFDAFSEHFGLESRTEAPDGQDKRIYFRLKSQEEFSGRGAIAVDGNGPAMAAVMTKPWALSYVSLGAALRVVSQGAPVRLLTLDGIRPTEKSIRDGSYRVQRPLQLITRGVPSGSVARFLQYVSGPAGQKIVREFDCLPVEVR